MVFYTKTLNDADKEKIMQWIPFATTIYNIGQINSCEVALLQDISDSNSNIFVSGQDDRVLLTTDIIDFINSGNSPLVLIHNHMGMETSFSNRDIEALYDYSRIVYIVVINSKQEIYVLGKTPKTKSRDNVFDIYWSWWSDSERKAYRLRLETSKMIGHSPLAIHASSQEYANLIKIEYDVIAALHNMTNKEEFIKFAEKAGFHGAYLYNEKFPDKM